MQWFSVRGVLASRAAIVVGAGVLLGIGVARAGKLDSGTEARTLVRALQTQPDGAPVAKEPVQRANSVLRRAAEARQQQREPLARLLEDFALEWALTAQHLVEVAEAEAEAQRIDQQLSEMDVKLRRARALLEETETRRGRARTELWRLDPASLDEVDSAGAGASTALVPTPPAGFTSAPATTTPPAPATTPEPSPSEAGGAR